MVEPAREGVDVNNESYNNQNSNPHEVLIYTRKRKIDSAAKENMVV
jgi:hypothetical protein